MAIIEVRELVKRYGDLTAVNGISFEVQQGEIFGIVGPNGACLSQQAADDSVSFPQG